MCADQSTKPPPKDEGATDFLLHIPFIHAKIIASNGQQDKTIHCVQKNMWLHFIQ